MNNFLIGDVVINKYNKYIKGTITDIKNGYYETDEDFKIKIEHQEYFVKIGNIFSSAIHPKAHLHILHNSFDL